MADDKPMDEQTPDAGADSAANQDAQGTALRQDEIDALLSQGAKQSEADGSNEPKRGSTESGEAITAGDIEFLLSQAEQALASVDQPVETDAEVRPFELKDFSGSPPSTDAATLELIRDVDLDLKIELGRTQMYLEDVLKLRKGSVVALDKLAGDPVDIFVNGRLVARGEILVLNDNFCVRIAELIAGVNAQAG